MKKTRKKTIKRKNKPVKAQKNKNYKIERISTGIKNFDKLIEGGFERNSTNLLVGGSGSGKTIFCVQFLLEGIKRGEKVLYITFEENKKDFYDNMRDFGWDLEKLEKEGKFIFLEYTPEKVKTMLEEGGGTTESIVLKEKISRIIIDSITSFELLFDDDLEMREAALSLFKLLGKWNCTSLLTYEENPVPDKKSSRTLEFEADSITLLYFLRTGKQRKRYIEVSKMRGTKHSLEIFPFSIEKQGIVVSATPEKNLKFSS